MKDQFKIVILAGGRGARMESELPKAIVPLKEKPMIQYLLDTCTKLGVSSPVIVVGYKAEKVKNVLSKKNIFVLQEKQLGTAHAVSCAKSKCQKSDLVVVLSSDQPNIKAKSILKTIKQHKQNKFKITLTTTLVSDFKSWRKYFLSHGRILRKGREIVGIKEYKDASISEKKIKEVNTGCCYVFDAKWLWANLSKIKNNNVQNEYYLTDLVKMAKEQGEKIGNMKISNTEALGANSKHELEVLEKFVV